MKTHQERTRKKKIKEGNSSRGNEVEEKREEEENTQITTHTIQAMLFFFKL